MSSEKVDEEEQVKISVEEVEHEQPPVENLVSEDKQEENAESESVPAEPVDEPTQQENVVEEAVTNLDEHENVQGIPSESAFVQEKISEHEIVQERISEHEIFQKIPSETEADGWMMGTGQDDDVPLTSDIALAEDESQENLNEDSSSDQDSSDVDDDYSGDLHAAIDDDNRDSMITHAGSYNSLSSSSSDKPSEEDETLPKGFQDYIKRYSTLFSKIAGTEDVPCDEDARKTFLKIDLNEIVSGYRTEEKLCRDMRSTLIGMTRTRQDLVFIENESIILQKGYEHFKGVRILTGGHMGNEPLYLDYVGKGMITGLVLGTVNDPPSVASVTKAMRELAVGAPGILVIIQNNVEYRLVFGLAMERIRLDGFLDIDMVAVGDDCFERCKSPVGRRGLAGIILILKIAGAMACRLKSLREIYIAVRTASKSIVTISCMTRPFKAIGTGLDKSSKDGIPFNGDNCQMIKTMVDYCVHPLKYFSMRLEPEESVIVLLNTYRTKSPEFYIIVDLLIKELEKRKIRIERFYGDNFLTGFWPGFSITLLLDYNNFRSKYMDAPCNSTLWPRLPSKGDAVTKYIEINYKRNFGEMGPMMTKTDVSKMKHAIVTACKAIIQCESILNSLHFFGNYGTKLRNGADAVWKAVRMKSLNFNRPFNLLIEISEILVENLPGVMGAMYGCLFEGAARSFVRSPLTTITAQNWSEAMDEALKTLRAYTNAKGGIVSLALSLIPVVSAIHGPYLKLNPRANRNPILAALDSLRREIELRMKQSSDEKESLLKNQLDVESYAMIIWLHAIYSSIYWKVPSELESETSIPSSMGSSVIEEEVNEMSIEKKSSSFNFQPMNRSLEFITAEDDGFITPEESSKRSSTLTKQSSVTRSVRISSMSQTRDDQSGKIFT